MSKPEDYGPEQKSRCQPIPAWRRRDIGSDLLRLETREAGRAEPPHSGERRGCALSVQSRMQTSRRDQAAAARSPRDCAKPRVVPFAARTCRRGRRSSRDAHRAIGRVHRHGPSPRCPDGLDRPFHCDRTIAARQEIASRRRSPRCRRPCQAKTRLRVTSSTWVYARQLAKP